MIKLIDLRQSPGNTCECCGAETVLVSWETQDFIYLDKGQDVTLTVKVPVFTCASCREQYTDYQAETIRHEAVCRHLGRLTPAEVCALRRKYDMSQAEFGAVTGVGVASIKRWETGALIQGAAHDNLLRLLGNPLNMTRLREKRLVEAVGTVRFRTEISFESITGRDHFKLRRHG